MSNKPILCIDFDGVLHSYTSGWQGADTISDAMVQGAAEFLYAAVGWFTVAVFSSRSNQPGGVEAMKLWLADNLRLAIGQNDGDWTFAQIEWPTEKPPAKVTIDDRAVTFTGKWPSLIDLLAFEPWNKRTANRDDEPELSFADLSAEKDGGLAAEAVETLRSQRTAFEAAR